MNLAEFSALKAGDTIENHFTHSRGVVSEASETGVKVRWGGEGSPPFSYSVVGTSWFHWSKVDDG